MLMFAPSKQLITYSKPFSFCKLFAKYQLGRASFKVANQKLIAEKLASVCQPSIKLRLSFQAATTQILQRNGSRRKFKDKIMIFILLLQFKRYTCENQACSQFAISKPRIQVNIIYIFWCKSTCDVKYESELNLYAVPSIRFATLTSSLLYTLNLEFAQRADTTRRYREKRRDCRFFLLHKTCCNVHRTWRNFDWQN